MDLSQLNDHKFHPKLNNKIFLLLESCHFAESGVWICPNRAMKFVQLFFYLHDEKIKFCDLNLNLRSSQQNAGLF